MPLTVRFLVSSTTELCALSDCKRPCVCFPRAPETKDGADRTSVCLSSTPIRESARDPHPQRDRRPSLLGGWATPGQSTSFGLPQSSERWPPHLRCCRHGR